MSTELNVEAAVRERYARAAEAQEAALCCPVTYDPQYLRVIPDAIKERDYGCGDPSAFVRAGETVLDLGSGSGKICYIAAQIVGAAGRVIGVDFNPAMLELANKYRAEIGATLGYHNVEFRRGRIQDLRLDAAAADAYLAAHPLTDLSALESFAQFCAEQKSARPLIADDSADVVLSNCVLNLVRPEDKTQLFDEIFRVVRRGGRVAISDIVSDEDVPAAMRNDAELWSGCIAGALREDEFINAFERAGFYGMEIVKRDETPWRTVAGIEFRALTVTAHKGKQGACRERKQAVIYRGPWRSVTDDDGHTLERGRRAAVCDKTFQIYNREPYAADIIAVEPYAEIALEAAESFDCARDTLRHPRETKGMDYDVTEMTNANACAPGGECC